MSKSTHLIPVEVSYLAEDFVKLYLKEIIGGHRVPLSIFSDFGTQFTVQLLKSFKKGFGLVSCLVRPFIIKNIV